MTSLSSYSYCGEQSKWRNYCTASPRQPHRGPDEGLTWWQQYNVARKWSAIEECTRAIVGGGEIAGSWKDSR